MIDLPVGTIFVDISDEVITGCVNSADSDSV